MNSTFGRLIGVSMGPGDPELITRRAWAALSRSGRWTYPVKKEDEDSFVLDIARRGGLPIPADALPLVFPMTTIPRILSEAWQRAATQTLACLAEGQDVLFLVEGDASTYSTFGHLARAVRQQHPENEVEVIPGVSSYCASAAQTTQPLVEADETLAVLPASYGAAIIEPLLDQFDRLVLLKVKPVLEEILDLLERRDLLQHAVYLEKIGTPEERMVTEVQTLRGTTVPYLSLLLVRNPHRTKPSIARGCRPRRTVQDAA